MLKTEPLRLNKSFRRMYARAKSTAGTCMVVYVRPNRLAVNRLGITVSSKLGGAVKRNRIRRRLKESYRLLECGINPGFDIVVVARSRSFDVPFSALTGEMKAMLAKQRCLITR